MRWNWQYPDWPNFTYDAAALAPLEERFRQSSGEVIGAVRHFTEDDRSQLRIELLSDEAVKTSEIEGEVLDRASVQSSLRRQFGLDADARPVRPQERGIAEMMADVYTNWAAPLEDEELFRWHAMLMSGNRYIETIGAYRRHDDAMQIVSGSVDRPVIHFEAPPSPQVPAEMARFVAWFNRSGPGGEAPLPALTRAAIGHLHFESVHPFEDGNGRIARAIADLALARSEGSSRRFYSMSAQIRTERNAYYDQLERTQKGGTDVTSWILWFLDCLGRAIHGADGVLAAVVAKGQFWERAAALALNERQIKVLNRLLDGFEGTMTSSKWAIIAKCSQDTANRDIAALLDRGLLRKGEGGGRSTHYELVL